MTIRVLVPAKVNLALVVHGRRPDGYHSISTVFHTIGVWDELLLQPAPALRFAPSGLPSPRGEANLCVKAYHLMRKLARGARGVHIRLFKRIPSGAGLGGGSADAAACLAGLNRLWRLGLAPAALRRHAARLGSDVPFFLAGGAAVGRGRGEILTPLPSRLAAWTIVAKPRFGISTAGAYAALDRSRPRKRYQEPFPGFRGTRAAVRRGDPAAVRAENDFEPVVAALHPKIPRLLRHLRRAGARPAFMSGSGSAVVGLVRTRSEAGRIARAIARSHKVKAIVAPLAPLKMRIEEGGRAGRA